MDSSGRVSGFLTCREVVSCTLSCRHPLKRHACAAISMKTAGEHLPACVRFPAEIVSFDIRGDILYCRSYLLWFVPYVGRCVECGSGDESGLWDLSRARHLYAFGACIHTRTWLCPRVRVIAKRESEALNTRLLASPFSCATTHDGNNLSTSCDESSTAEVCNPGIDATGRQ